MEKLPAILDGKRTRPTISLALIAKNEEKNVDRLLNSVEGCFDEIIFVDTGSTDQTVSKAFARGCKTFHFDWCDDFSKARNFAFSKCTSDYIAWLDLDDVLNGRESFIKWRDHAMEFCDFWFNTYEYALDKDLNPVVSFVRERVMKRSLGAQWQYPLHEGIIAKPEWTQSYITTWSVKHMRDEADIKADKSRNIRILEAIVKSSKVDARMQFYYGKELFEAGRAQEAILAFEKCFKMPDLQPHDRILGLQYASYSAMNCFDQMKPEAHGERERLFNLTLTFAMDGIKADPNRAEFHALLGDAYLRLNDIQKAVPYFAAAKACLKNFDTKYEGAIYSFKNLYGEQPSLQLGKIYAHLGLLDKARKEVEECIALYNNEEAKGVLVELNRITSLVTLKNDQKEVSDIVFTCPPQTPYEFDEEIYKTKPLGGSETALVQMARLLKEKTGRNVKVFNMRTKPLVADSGVEYLPATELNAYLSKNKPAVNIAWRHNIKVTEAPTYLWCHDLVTPGVESQQSFDKILCLSEFHKSYVSGLQGVPEEKIIVTRNGITPSKFKFQKPKKNENKIVWLSSPDRGLERAMLVMDEVRREFPEMELHVYYGIEGLYKYGPVMSALADKLKAMMDARPWVKYHGFTEQSKMYKEVSDAVIWLHPNNFIETYAITAIECLSNGIFPVVRRLGALANTLCEAEKNRQAVLLDYEWDDPDGIKIHANATCRVLLNRQWENLKGYDVNQHDWSHIADSWIEFMGLAEKSAEAAS